MSSKSKILIIGQAPGLIVHKTGKPWDDKSGENLRNWMGINDKVFYDNKKIGIMPMGFCYPGKGKSGDLPPRKECAPEWHEKLLDKLDTPSLILLIGSYAQNYYLGKKKLKTLTDTVKNYHQFLPKYFVLPHPSPRNNTWMKKNPWFKNEVIPTLKNKVLESLSA
ncbi:MAG: uracil-DNA glycosylase family protein [Saprospiraceae bacterium]|nr:uracil-DNA glycosylase family protein [Saprospiraceae bacterium]